VSTPRTEPPRTEPPIAIRAACPGDAPALLGVHARAIRGLAGLHYSEAQRDAWIARMSVERLREAVSSRHLIVAEAATAQGPRVVGYGQLHPVEGAIEAIYVDPEYSRRGIGRSLCDALEERARALRLPGLVLDASLNSVPFYAAMGFRERCLDHHELAPGVRFACAVMEKRFASPGPGDR
jgi:ribosomal protein S18 acetylase RimI-like enzyme